MTVTNGIRHIQDPPEPIAIVSAACRLPGHVNSPHKLWELLQSGGTAVSNEVPKSRFSSEGHFDGSGRPGTMKALSGMFIEDIDPAAFDASFFNITRADAISMEPQQRQLLEVVYECFENGGIPIEEVSGKEIGCYVGSLNGDYHDMQMRDPEQRMAGHAVGTGRAILSNRISHFFNLQGSSFTIDTACSSGLVGVDVACKNLRAGTLSGAVVAGVNLWLSPEHTEERGTMRAAYSASGKCHTFDAKADGYCRAEAVNAVYLKRLSDAVRDGDPIRALIRGTASNSDGWTPGINSPSSEAQAAMIREAYKNAGIDKNHYIETGYLECHGTGTPAGDPLEVKGAASVLAHMRPHTDPLIIGSVKSNIGHSEPGAGLSGLIKAMLAVEEGKIPGNPTFFNPNPAINFDDLRVHATRPGIAWPKESHHYRRASVNSFGFGGSNAHAILDNVDHYLAKHHTFPKLPKSHVSSFINLSDMLSLFDGLQSSKTVTQRPQVLVFSANDMDSLKRQIMTTSAHLLNPRVKVKLSDLSFTLSDRRSRHFCRAFLLGYPTKSGHASKLAIEDAQFSKTPQEEARIGFVFTGQGAQWSKMGAKLVETFPVTSKRVLEELDKALQELPLDIRPEWSLQEELTQARSSERLSQPEFSQPLVTALQLTQLAVLESWNVRAEGVVGHSSGEIAAACSAGFITPRQAILNAYFRGIAGKSVLSTSRKGMMAVGLSAKDVQSYIDDANVFKDDVVIACYNSPASVTISGSASSLAEVEDRVKAAGHFARILRVEVAYHSHHMTEIADRYEKLLIEHGGLEECGKVTPVSKYMISTVTENEVTGSEVCTAAYWKANMLSPVRFDGACTKMIKSNKLSPNFLLELGPSNTLAGPVTQIAKAAKTDQLTYAATNKRGEVDSCRAMFDVAGHLFLQNARFSLGKVNICEGSPNEVKPAVIVDLPNYQWKHSIQYWHESLASKDWRFKKFPAHDLLGSKVLGTLWQSPSWHRLLRLSDVPWLRDHQIGSEILFPAAGYITMAMEAVRQTALSTATTSEYDILKTKNYRYCLRDVQFPRGLVLEDDVEVHVMLLLVPMPKLGQEWWEFKITSLVESSSIASSSSPAPSPEKWKINSSGLVRLELNPGPAFSHATEDIFSLPLNNPTPGQMWYKSMKDAGYAYGPDFQKLVAVESMEGKSRSRSLISLTPPRTKWEPQSEYAVHPAPLDSVLQSMFTSLHRGNRSKLENVLVPRSIGEVTVSSHTWKSGEAVSVTTSSNASGDASLYDPVSGSLIMQLNGLSFTPLLDGRDSVYMSHTYTQLMWKPDFQHLDTDEKLRQAMLGDDNSKPHIQQILDLAAHKAPNLTVLEVNLVPGSTESLWFASDETPRPVRTALTEFHFASNNAENVLSAQERYAEWPAARASRYSVLDPFSKTFTMPAGSSKFDLVVIHWSQDNYSGSLETLAANLRRLISEGGNVVFYDSNLSSSTEDNQMNEGSPFYALQNLGLIKVRQTTSGSCIVAEVAPEEVPSPSNNNKIFVVRFSSAESTIMDDTISQLRAKGWDLDEIHINNQSDGKLSALAPESTVLVLDELARPLLATATGEEWSTVQTIIQRECNLVWVTQGSQITPTTPLNAVAHGVFRTVRAEVPMIRIITLDVESASPGNLGTNAIAINTALLEVNSPKERFIPIEREIVERGGLLYVSRVWPDAGVNKRKVEDNAGGPPSRLTNFHDSKSTISLVTSRPGSLDALHFAEQPKSQVIGPEEVEVELFASGCNARDVDGAMGSVHGDSGKLGLEGAGVVVRVGESVSTRHVGQRVAVFGNWCFSNRVIVSCKTTFTLPDNLSFEDAATLPVAFITGIYALRRLAPVQREDRVLVHSAFTSVGIACVRLCQSSGCDTFVTVSSLEQRQFLAQELALPEDHIFASESTTLLRALHNVTDGHGFDVIISQPMNGNLDYEDGRLLAPGGRLIKITNGGLDTGKLLSTGSLAANCSFQNLDIMALPHNTIESVFSELSQLTADGHLPPLSPITCLSYDEIPTALGLLREGLHIGKIVISDDLGASLAIPVQPAPTLPESILKPDHSYLFVGGLKGISGSLAIHLASNGAKHIAVMSRGGYEDKVSQHMARNIRALGCSLSLHQGDVTSIKDVRRVFSEILVPVGGIIQGAAVFRDRTFESMSHADYHAALACKVTGTSNLHSVSLETNQPITFFTMLSSISGVIGQKGQANYAGGNAFEDAFAAYRRASGLPAISINLGPIEDVGVISNNEDLQSRFDGSTLLGINEGLMRRIFDYSILQQHPDPHRRLNVTSQGQMITSLLLPQPEDSDLLQDIRFRGLRVLGGDGPRSRGDASKDKETQTLLFMIQSQDPDLAAVRTAAIVVVGSRLTKQLRLTDALDPARPLSYYGLDSLAAVELRNWVRITLGVEVTTLDVMNAASLGEFCDKVVGKMGVAM